MFIYLFLAMALELTKFCTGHNRSLFFSINTITETYILRISNTFIISHSHRLYYTTQFIIHTSIVTFKSVFYYTKSTQFCITHVHKTSRTKITINIMKFHAIFSSCFFGKVIIHIFYLLYNHNFVIFTRILVQITIRHPRMVMINIDINQGM